LVTPTSSNVDLRDIRVVKKIGGTIEDTELVEGVVLNQNVVVSAGGPTRMEKAKIAIIQFQLSPPKPDVSILCSAMTLVNFDSRWTTQSSSTTTVLWTK
jgi:chaperonin GroEL (HSP60 family)